MLAPNDLKKGEFTKNIRGYSIQEVDAYIEYLMRNYEELYGKYTEMEQSGRDLYRKYKEATLDREAVKNDLADARIASDRIIEEAKEKAELIIRASKNNCDYIINDFRRTVSEEREKLIKIQAQLQSFKESLLKECREHMDLIDDLTEIADTALYYSSDDDLVGKVLDEIKTDVRYAMVDKERMDNISEEEVAVDLDCFSEEPIPGVEEKEVTRIGVLVPGSVSEDSASMDKTIQLPDQKVSEIGDKYMEFLEGLETETDITNKE